MDTIRNCAQFIIYYVILNRQNHSVVQINVLASRCGTSSVSVVQLLTQRSYDCMTLSARWHRACVIPCLCVRSIVSCITNLCPLCLGGAKHGCWYWILISNQWVTTAMRQAALIGLRALLQGLNLGLWRTVFFTRRSTSNYSIIQYFWCWVFNFLSNSPRMPVAFFASYDCNFLRFTPLVHVHIRGFSFILS